ncbi:Aspartate/methionine/tyrosine aminotransferase [Sulfitobacter brevis]|uniref:Aminotransferase n=1 Tax=Sulfitobacter brevis TaxID=74348 RepID=A0A1I2BGC0_9RHOB|nr:aminotransferase [Sulfitobacter brevis]SFE55211.1 Aspartate/methionine/tyrosine aminotransferase [Sulfitobacter brevis]
MKIEPFGVEIWMNEYETKCALNLAETCVESLTIAELLTLTGRNADDLSALLEMKMTYGAIEGSERLRAAISGLYAQQPPENIVVTHGTIGANMLVHRALVERGDRVVSIVPTYQQHYSIPASIGADVHMLHLREDQNWLPDLDALRALVQPGTKLIALTNPNNPTGALIPREMLLEIAEIARAADAWVLCDEVYRGTDQAGSGMTASMADLYEKGISTAGMSKAYSLAGLRLGWVAAPRVLIDQVLIQRDYDTISVGVIDDHFATLALENHERVLARSRAITRGNLAVLAEWIAAEPKLSWVRPASGTTALVKVDLPISSRDFCVALLEETGVMFTPGSALGMEGYVRIGYANTPAILAEGLPLVSAFLARH